MNTFVKKVLRWGSGKSLEPRKNNTSLLMAGLIGILEDVLFWKNMWFSLSFILVLNIVFFVCVHRQINLLGFLCCFCATVMSIDALEAWLKFKHRTNFLKRFANYEGIRLKFAFVKLLNWMKKRLNNLIYLREVNHTKEFLLLNIIFSLVFLIGKYVNGYVFSYMLCMLLCFVHKLAPPILRYVQNIQQNAESDGELEGLIPEMSEIDIKLLSIEPEHNQVIDEKQSLDYWKPVDMPLEEASDSSDNSSSLVTNLSMEKMQTFDKEVETSDSSEDEYIPLVKQKQLQTTLEIVQPADTWGASAFNAVRNITGAVTGLMYSTQDQNKRKRLHSIDSSDGFEMIDKNELN